MAQSVIAPIYAYYRDIPAWQYQSVKHPDSKDGWKATIHHPNCTEVPNTL